MKLSQEFIDQLQKMVEQSTTNNAANSQNNPNSTQGGKQAKKKPEEILLDLAINKRNLYYDRNLTTYIEVQDVKLQQAVNNYLIKIESPDFDRWLINEYHTNHKKVLLRGPLLESIKILVSTRAKLNGQQIELHNRIASEGGAIYLDMGTLNRQVIKIDKSGWIVGTYPVFFKRHKDMAELPIPERGGSIEDIIPFLPPMPRRDQCFVLCWLIASFFVKIERAFLLIEGPQGTGKTTLSKILKSFIDPAHGKAITYNDNVNMVAQILDHHCIPLIDNVTSISKSVSDLICTAYSEGIHNKRKQYTDDEDIIFNITGNVIFNTIRLKSPKSDFLNRCYKVVLEPGEKSYRSKQEFSERFETVKGKLFGAVLDVVSKTMVRVGNVPPTGKYRTVDFDRYATAAAEVMGYGAELFLEARKHSENIKLASITNSTPIIAALSKFLTVNNRRYSGTLNRLLQQLLKDPETSADVPKYANVLSRRLNEIGTELNAAGITATRKYNGHSGAVWEIVLAEEEKDTDNVPGELKDLSAGQITDVTGQGEQSLEIEESVLEEPVEDQESSVFYPLLDDVVDDFSVQNSDSVDIDDDIWQLFNDAGKNLK